jgi:hypothetical protein
MKSKCLIYDILPGVPPSHRALLLAHITLTDSARSAIRCILKLTLTSLESTVYLAFSRWHTEYNPFYRTDTADPESITRNTMMTMKTSFSSLLAFFALMCWSAQGFQVTTTPARRASPRAMLMPISLDGPVIEHQLLNLPSDSSISPLQQGVRDYKISSAFTDSTVNVALQDRYIPTKEEIDAKKMNFNMIFWVRKRNHRIKRIISTYTSLMVVFSLFLFERAEASLLPSWLQFSTLVLSFGKSKRTKHLATRTIAVCYSYFSQQSHASSLIVVTT